MKKKRLLLLKPLLRRPKKHRLRKLRQKKPQQKKLLPNKLPAIWQAMEGPASGKGAGLFRMRPENPFGI
ncbi:hypothetical protein HAD_04130 [Hyphomonas adhaerens MHS-3]|uniref:Uncharacterized protein n=1 Tax=Hyphomonas adhaerens MHS-3 TaxID=1280949 RepID=A0A069E4I5_9PROT|nr:hypothetical protein HAD_04130 [Hyphomonas adhaerens MHS-3]